MILSNAASRAAFVVVSSTLACSHEALHRDGASCRSPFECASGLCVTRPTGDRVCARRCATSDTCAATEVCGRFDFRGVDDAGVRRGEEVDIVRACRAPLSRTCDGGCIAGEQCVAQQCALTCTSREVCGGRACVRSPGCSEAHCAAPCDDVRDCPARHFCNVAIEDRAGHGSCEALDGDAATMSPNDASECGITR